MGTVSAPRIAETPATTRIHGQKPTPGRKQKAPGCCIEYKQSYEQDDDCFHHVLLLTNSVLHFQPASPDQPLEELPVAQKLHAVAAASLVPASEPEQGHDLLIAKAALGKLVPFSGVCLNVRCYVELFFSLDLLLHVHVPSTKARPFAPSCQ